MTDINAIRGSDVGQIELWGPTMNFRWLCEPFHVDRQVQRAVTKVLQQQWVSNHGKYEWKAVPEVIVP